MLNLMKKSILVLVLFCGGMVWSAAPEGRDAWGRTPLINAVKNSDVDEVKRLLAVRADINAQDQYGSSALMFAAKTNNVPLIKLLVEAQADVNMQDTVDGQTALMEAVFFGYIDVVRELLFAQPNLGLHNTTWGMTAEGVALDQRSMYADLGDQVKVNIYDTILNLLQNGLGG